MRKTNTWTRLRPTDRWSRHDNPVEPLLLAQSHVFRSKRLKENRELVKEHLEAIQQK